MHWSIGNKVNLGFGLALAFLAAIGAVSYRSITQLIETVHWEVHAHKVLNELHDVLFQMQNAETGQRGYIITGEARYLEPYKTAITETDQEVRALRSLTADNPVHQRHLDTLEGLIAKKFAELEETITLRENGQFDAALQVIRTDRGKAIMDDIRRVIDAMEAEENTLVRKREAEADENAWNTTLVLVAGSVLAFGLVAVAIVIINRDVAGRQRAEDAVREAYAALETRVRERTAELAEVNAQLRGKISEIRRAEDELEKNRDDMAAILNQLRVGTVKTDKQGRVTFLSRVAQSLFGRENDHALGVDWEQLFPLQPREKAQLKASFQLPPHERAKIPVRMEVSGKRNYWMEIELQDDPREAQSKIFFLYDVSEVYDLRRLLDEKTQLQGLVGKSKPMQLVYQQIRTAASVDSTVLIVGKTGTGKELVARAIHALGHRQDKPFIAVNSAGLTDSLLGSQLFGHKRGAFTGAIQDHQGVFEAAAEGTIFLDEIGDIPVSVQTSLLRVLQEKEITRLGESRPRKIDVRIIAASQRQLDDEVARGNFRADLLYRIRVARIQLPTLHERRKDIPLLVARFLDQYQATTGKPVQEVSNEAMRVLLEYPWPGNVRELKSAIEFAFIRGAEVIRVEDLPPEVVDPSASPRPLLSIGSDLDEKQRVLAALDQAGQNRTLAARLLGMSRATFYRHLTSLNIPLD